MTNLPLLKMALRKRGATRGTEEEEEEIEGGWEPPIPLCFNLSKILKSKHHHQSLDLLRLKQREGLSISSLFPFLIFWKAI